MNVKVVKFGGSSLADAEQFRKVANIIKADPARRYVVPSAPGKRFSGSFLSLGCVIFLCRRIRKCCSACLPCCSGR